jgi:pSer/pThr/pTyr-binding forkhead associated (FHA) protein
MTTKANSKSVGRDPGCDLVLDKPDISQIHASLELKDNGLVSVKDNDSVSGTYLNRSDHWIRVREITLCIADRVRFGAFEVPLQQLTSVFGQQSNARLEARHFSLLHGNKPGRSFADQPGSAPTLNNPVRNPVTGKIEEHQ